jgi:ParB-like chromosome segregation protein Spo0J
MNSTLTPIGEIKTNPDNPRILKDDKFKKLVRSIKSFPEMLKVRPIVVNDDMVVLGGNMRLKACKEAGLKEVHVLKASGFTQAQQREFIIKDNVGFGEWDWDMVANEWNTEQVSEWGLDIPVYGDGEEEDTQTGREGNFDDDGIIDNSQYGVIVMCSDGSEQEKIYKKLLGFGYECKVVVT